MIRLNQAQIFLTDRCNMDCSYCFFKNSKTGSQKLSFKQIKDFLIWFLNYPGDKKKIELIGGEPLLEFDLLKKTVFFIRNKENCYQDTKITIQNITTNGTILNKKILDFIKKVNLKLNFSLDGGFEGNLNRKFKNGTNSFPVIWRNLLTYRKEIGEPYIFMTISPNNAKSFYSNIKFLINNGFCNINFMTELLSGRWTEKTVNIFLKEFRKLLKYYTVLKYRNSNIHISSIDEMRNSDKHPLSYTPDQLGDQAVLHFDGNIYGCPLAPTFNEKFRNFCLLHKHRNEISTEKLIPMRKFNLFKQLGLKYNHSHQYIRRLEKMLCLCFDRKRSLMPSKLIKNNIKLLIRLYEEIKEKKSE